MWLLLWFLVAGGLGAQGATSPPPLVIRGGTFIPGAGRPPLRGQAMLLQGGRIRQMGPLEKLKLPPGVRVLDARGGFVIPGLFDAHVHLASTLTPQGEVQEEVQKLLDGFLLCGVTSVLDLWATDEIFVLRKLVREGAITAPRLFAAGAGLSAPGSHGTQFGYAMAPITSVTEVQARVRRLAALGADVVKIAIEPGRRGGRLGSTLDPLLLRAIVKEAHRQGLPVAVHALTVSLAREAVEAGADILAHIFTGQRGGADLVAAIKRRKVFVIPCLVVEEPLLRLLHEPDFLKDPLLRRAVDPRLLAHFPSRGLRSYGGTVFAQAARLFPQALAHARALVRAGCPLVGGSDAANLAVFHGPGLLREALLLERAGLSRAQVLEALTLGGARLLHLEGQQGTLEVGKRADLVLLGANPLKDLKNLEQVREVVKGGRVVDLERLRQEVAGLVQHPLPPGPLLDLEGGIPESVTKSRFVGVVESGGGPHSAVAFQVLREGGEPFLRVSGLLSSRPLAEAGVALNLWPFGLWAADLEKTPVLSFRVRGDGRPYLLEATTLDAGSGIYARAFRAGAAWRARVMNLRLLREEDVPGHLPLDARCLLTLRFVTAANQRGPFHLDLTDLRLLPAAPR